ncbi:MAG: NUDIX hydrolase [Candidatus Levybacteria bacterium]|nr:NUDIX hydrolase [Candidatus Levybacteria bacterium]
MQPKNEKGFYTFCPYCANKLILKTIDDEEVKACTNCDFIFWNNPKPVTSIILKKDNKILMLQKASDPFKEYWVLPGGFIKHEETAELAIKREAKEEIGSDVIVEGLIGVYRIDNDPRGIHIDIIYHGKLNGEIKLGKEDKSWHYFFINELPEHIAYKHREAINDWQRKGNQYG